MKARIDEIMLDKINFAGRVGRVDMKYIEEHEHLLEDFGLDSLDVMEIILECEGEFGKKIPNEQIVSVRTKHDIYRLFEAENVQK